MSLQVGSGLSGQPNNSYALYNASLVDDCLQLPSAGCNRTIAFGWQVPFGFNHQAFSTVRRRGTNNTADNVGNSGILITTSQNVLLVLLYGNQSMAHLIAPFTALNPGTWNHIAFSYRGTTDFAIYLDFSSTSLQLHDFSLSRVSAEPFMASGILEGSRDPVTGFDAIDELMVFPDALTASQIAQLNPNSN